MKLSHEENHPQMVPYCYHCLKKHHSMVRVALYVTLYPCVCFIVETEILKVYTSFWSFHVVHDFYCSQAKVVKSLLTITVTGLQIITFGTSSSVGSNTQPGLKY